VQVEGLGAITGDICWGGNWFFLVDGSPYPLEPSHLPALTQAAQSVSDALAAEKISGDGGAPIDHIEFFGPPQTLRGNSRNFVLCPGGAYDRSPCGTGTSAKLAALAASGKLAPGVDWIQESILGSRFVARYRLDGSGNVVPSITGRAFVVAEAQLLQHPDDPFREGIRLR
jgi:proline racemase